MHHFVLFAMLICMWSLKPFIKKFSGRSLTSFEFMVIQSTIYMSIIISVYLYKPDLVDVSNYKRLSQTELGAILLLGIMSVLSSFLFQHLVKKFDVNYLLPHIQPLVLVTTIAFGYLYGEVLVMQQAVGIGAILAGILLLNSS